MAQTGVMVIAVCRIGGLKYVMSLHAKIDAAVSIDANANDPGTATDLPADCAAF